MEGFQPEKRKLKVMVGVDGSRHLTRGYGNYSYLSDNGDRERILHFVNKYGINHNTECTLSPSLISDLIKKLKLLKFRGHIDKEKMIRLYQLCTSSDSETAKMGFQLYRQLCNKLYFYEYMCH